MDVSGWLNGGTRPVVKCNTRRWPDDLEYLVMMSSGDWGSKGRHKFSITFSGDTKQFKCTLAPEGDSWLFAGYGKTIDDAYDAMVACKYRD